MLDLLVPHRLNSCAHPQTGPSEAARDPPYRGRFTSSFDSPKTPWLCRILWRVYYHCAGCSTVVVGGSQTDGCGGIWDKQTF